jgi:hypothetical protein
MKPYLSCWSYGYHGKDEEMIYDMYHLSAFLLKEIYGEVHLITDLEGKERLKKIKFSSVETHLEDLPKDLRVAWSLGKVYSYKVIAEKNEPFFHIDNDVFLFKELPDHILANDIIVQHKEEGAYDFYDADFFIKNIPNPFYLKDHKISYAANMSIFGGFNIEFIKNYAENVLKLALDKENQNFLRTTSFNKSFQPACMIEQYSMSLLADANNVDVYYLFNNFLEFDSKSEEIGFCHLWSAKHHNKELHNKIKKLKYYYNLK